MQWLAPRIVELLSPMPLISWFLFITPNVLCGVALVLALRRKCFNTLPLFCSNLGYFVLQLVVGVALLHFDKAYGWFMLFGGLASNSLELAVVYELSNKLVSRHSSIARLFRPLPRWSAAVLVLLATVAAAFFHPHWQVQEERAALILSFATNFIVIGLLLTLLLITHMVGVSWRGLPAGIALGLGFSATGELAGAALFAQPGRAFAGDLIRLGSWQVCVAVWLVYLLLPERRVNAREAGLRISELGACPQELQKIVRPLNPD